MFFKLGAREFHFSKYKKNFFFFKYYSFTPEIEEKKILEEYEKTLNLEARKFNSPKYKENFFWNKEAFSDCFLFLTFLRLTEKCPQVALASNTPKTLTLTLQLQNISTETAVFEATKYKKHDIYSNW